MPVDRKRINGPENAVPYQLFSKLNLKNRKQQFEGLYVQDDSTGEKRRRDSRKDRELRQIYMKTGTVTQAKGSAYIEVNNTKVVVSVFDPREIPNKSDYSPKGEVYCEFKYAPFSCTKRRLHQQDSEEKLNSFMMKQALEATVCREEFPNLQVDVYAMVLENDGSALSASITAAGVALAHAAIPMYGLISSASVGIQGGSILLDPTYKEEVVCSVNAVDDNESHGILVNTYIHSHDQISQMHQIGHLSLQDMEQALKVLETAHSEIHLIVKRCLVVHVTSSLEDGSDNKQASG